MESWTDVAVEFFLRCNGCTGTRCIRAYRKPGTYGCTKNRVHTGVPPYIFLTRMNTSTVPRIKNRKCAGAKFWPKSADGAIDGDALLRNASRAMADLLARKAA